jgi:hypothetical protein
MYRSNGHLRAHALTDRERQRETDRERQTERDREKDRETETQRQRHRDTETQRHRDTETQRHRDTERSEQLLHRTQHDRGVVCAHRGIMDTQREIDREYEREAAIRAAAS